MNMNYSKTRQTLIAEVPMFSNSATMDRHINNYRGAMYHSSYSLWRTVAAISWIVVKGNLYASIREEEDELSM